MPHHFLDLALTNPRLRLRSRRVAAGLSDASIATAALSAPLEAPLEARPSAAACRRRHAAAATAATVVAAAGATGGVPKAFKELLGGYEVTPVTRLVPLLPACLACPLQRSQVTRPLPAHSAPPPHSLARVARSNIVDATTGRLGGDSLGAEADEPRLEPQLSKPLLCLPVMERVQRVVVLALILPSRALPIVPAPDEGSNQRANQWQSRGHQSTPNSAGTVCWPRRRRRRSRTR